nr:hypothetical protein [Tanacetum cinerariifolium]
MAIPVVMLNNNIKASAKYSKFLAKSEGSKPIKATCIGKGSLTKKGVEIDVEKASILKKGRSKTVVEEVGEGFGVTPKVPDELSLKSSNKRASVILEVPDEPSDYSSSSSSISELAVEDILSDKENVTEKLDEANNTETKKETDE